VSAWLARLRELDAGSAPLCQPCQPCQTSPIGRDTPTQINLPDGFGTVGTVGTGISPETGPATDAPVHVWSAWLDQQNRLLDQDLAAEGTTLNRVLASMRPKRRKRTQEEVRQARWCRVYLADFAARPGTPLTPCACGNAVFYQLVGDCRWRCRSCERVTARARVRWFVLDPRLVEVVQQIQEMYPGAAVAEVRARSQPA
jgi:hypothetical protein